MGCETERASWNAAQALNYAGQGELEKALSLMEKAVEQDPDNGRLRLKLASFLAENGEGELGINQCDLYLEKHPNDWSAFDSRAQCKLFLGRFGEALADYKKSISDHVNRDRYELNQLAYYRALAGVEYDKAKEEIGRAIQETEDDYWGSSLNVPLRIRSLVAAGLISRYLDEQDFVLPELSKQIDQFDSQFKLITDALNQGILGEMQLGVPLRESVEKSLVDIRWGLERHKQSLAALLVTRALMYEDLGRTDLVDADRIQIQELGFKFDKIANDLPYKQGCFSILNISSAYLDTRGYVLSRMPWSDPVDGQFKELDASESNYEMALEDLNCAVIAAEILNRAVNSSLFNSPDIPMREVEYMRRNVDRSLAVFFYHRMKLNERAGMTEAAKVDEQKIIELGYQPGDNLF